VPHDRRWKVVVSYCNRAFTIKGRNNACAYPRPGEAGQIHSVMKVTRLNGARYVDYYVDDDKSTTAEETSGQHCLLCTVYDVNLQQTNDYASQLVRTRASSDGSG